jgi:nucleotide-binding universal stress UspA family protein
MYKKILFPTDFSDVATKAVKYIKQLKGAGAQEVILLHVIDEKELMVLSRAPDQYMNIMEAMKKEVAAEMATVVTELKSEGFHVKPELRTGNPFKVIMETAADEKVSIIVLGSHGKSNISEMLMGSISENVIRHSTVPLLVISREATKDA